MATSRSVSNPASRSAVRPAARAEGRPASRSDRRRDAILTAARELFLERGYAETSMDEIVRRAGGSKASAYVYFGSKEGLFRALVDELPLDVPTGTEPGTFVRTTPRETLHAYGLALAERLVSRDSMRLLGLAVTESARFPELGRGFYEAGPQVTRQRLADYLGEQTRAGRLAVPDPLRAAEFFQGMILYWPRLLLFLCVIKRPGRPELDALVAEAVEVFLAAYGAKRTPPRRSAGGKRRASAGPR